MQVHSNKCSSSQAVPLADLVAAAEEIVKGNRVIEWAKQRKLSLSKITNREHFIAVDDGRSLQLDVPMWLIVVLMCGGDAFLPITSISSGTVPLLVKLRGRQFTSTVKTKTNTASYRARNDHGTKNTDHGSQKMKQ